MTRPGPDAERAAFDALYRQWAPTVHAAAFRLLRCRDEADGATQEVFARLWARGRDAWSAVQAPRTFFTAAGRREALHRLRAARFEGMPLPTHFPSPAAGADDAVAVSELTNVVELALSQLPPRCASVMRLVLLNGWTHGEVAQELGISVKGVEKQVARGRPVLQRMLAERAVAGRRSAAAVPQNRMPPDERQVPH